MIQWYPVVVSLMFFGHFVWITSVDCWEKHWIALACCCFGSACPCRSASASQASLRQNHAQDISSTVFCLRWSLKRNRVFWRGRHRKRLGDSEVALREKASYGEVWLHPPAMTRRQLKRKLVAVPKAQCMLKVAEKNRKESWRVLKHTQKTSETMKLETAQQHSTAVRDPINCASDCGSTARCTEHSCKLGQTFTESTNSSPALQSVTKSTESQNWKSSNMLQLHSFPPVHYLTLIAWDQAAKGDQTLSANICKHTQTYANCGACGGMCLVPNACWIPAKAPAKSDALWGMKDWEWMRAAWHLNRPGGLQKVLAHASCAAICCHALESDQENFITNRNPKITEIIRVKGS